MYIQTIYHIKFRSHQFAVCARHGARIERGHRLTQPPPLFCICALNCHPVSDQSSKPNHNHNSIINHPPKADLIENATSSTCLSKIVRYVAVPRVFPYLLRRACCPSPRRFARGAGRSRGRGPRPVPSPASGPAPSQRCRRPAPPPC